jgi:D-alanyl-D-alanine carboxypeptidase/D-alanyl-D-alanine-endopeptidase (penicillin-binding protein 4)
VLAEHRSAPLAEILKTTNKSSQNLYAEQLLRAASREALGESDIDAAERHAKKILEDLGVDVAGLAIDDGSGLTRRDLVHPAQFADLLVGIWNSRHRELFLDTLPIAGVDGTLSGRFRDTVAKEHVRAKTGSIARVAALSGYVLRPGENTPPLVFSVMLNNFVCSSAEARDALDSFVIALARHAGWEEN